MVACISCESFSFTPSPLPFRVPATICLCDLPTCLTLPNGVAQGVEVVVVVAVVLGSFFNWRAACCLSETLSVCLYVPMCVSCLCVCYFFGAQFFLFFVRRVGHMVTSWPTVWWDGLSFLPHSALVIVIVVVVFRIAAEASNEMSVFAWRVAWRSCIISLGLSRQIKVELLRLRSWGVLYLNNEPFMDWLDMAIDDY